MGTLCCGFIRSYYSFPTSSLPSPIYDKLGEGGEGPT